MEKAEISAKVEFSLFFKHFRININFTHITKRKQYKKTT